MINTERFYSPPSTSIYMCTLYYFYFPSSRVIQLTPYFMILLVLIFIVNRNFKLLNRRSILLLFSFMLLPFYFLYFFVLLLFALLLSYIYHCYLLVTVIIYSLIYLFIYSRLLYYLFVYFVVLTCMRYNLLSPLPT